MMDWCKHPLTWLFGAKPRFNFRRKPKQRDDNMPKISMIGHYYYAKDRGKVKAR